MFTSIYGNRKSSTYVDIGQTLCENSMPIKSLLMNGTQHLETIILRLTPDPDALERSEWYSYVLYPRAIPGRR